MQTKEDGPDARYRGADCPQVTAILSRDNRSAYSAMRCTSPNASLKPQ